MGRAISDIGVCPRSKRKRRELPTPNLGHILYGRTSTCSDPEVYRSKVKVTGL